MIRRLLSFVTLLTLLAAPVLAQQKPLVIVNGQTRQMPNGGELSVPGRISADQVGTTQVGTPSIPGSVWGSEFHPNWNVVRTTKLFNPTEWQIYSSAANGIAQVVSGTNQVVRVSGTPFDASWVGKPFFYWEGGGYRVASVTDADHLTVQTTGGGAVSWGASLNGTYYFVLTDAAAICNVSGTSVTWVNGNTFIPSWSGLAMTINGTPVTFTFNSPTSLTLTSGSLGTIANASCYQAISINNELSNIRLQGLAGSNEENFAITFSPDGTRLQSTYAGGGKYRPIWIGTGENPTGTFNPMLAMRPGATLGAPGNISIGGDAGNQALTVNQNSSNVNHLLMSGGVGGGLTSIAARGADTSVGMAFDLKGANRFAFSSGSFSKPELDIYGSGGDCYSGINSASTENQLLTLGGPNCNLKLSSGASGVVYSPTKFQAPILRVPPAAAPASPVDGDVWATNAGVYARAGGVVRKLSNDYVTPQDFGAVCDNATNDYAAVQAAVGAAQTQGKKLFFPRCSYVLGSQVVITSPIDVEMDDSANLRFTNAASCGIDIDLRAASSNYGLNTLKLGGLYAPSVNSTFNYPGYPSSWNLSGRSTCDAVSLRGGSRLDIEIKYILGFNAGVRLSGSYDVTNGARAPVNINVKINTADILTYGVVLDGGPANAETMAALDVEFNTVFAKFPVYFKTNTKTFGQASVRVTGQAFTNEAGGACVYGEGALLSTTSVDIRWCYAGYSAFDSPIGTSTSLTLPYLAGDATSNGSTTDGNATLGYFNGFNNHIRVGAAIDQVSGPGGFLPGAGRVVRVRDAGVNNEVEVANYGRSQGSPITLSSTQGEANFNGGVGGAATSRKTLISFAVPTLANGASAVFYAYSSLLSDGMQKPLLVLPSDTGLPSSGLTVTTVDNSGAVNREAIITVTNRTGSTVTGTTYTAWLSL